MSIFTDYSACSIYYGKSKLFYDQFDVFDNLIINLSGLAAFL